MLNISICNYRKRGGKMRDYSKHFLLDTESASQYAKDVLEIFNQDEKIHVEEIGDGNINYVFKVVSDETNKSIVIKQADKLLRSSGRPLDLHRNKIEAEILKIQGKLAEGMVPKVYYYDENMCALCMEDISECKNLRKELLKGKKFSNLSEGLSNFLVDTLLPTTDLVMDRAEKKEQVKLFTNPELCDISEDLVFTEPYWDYKGRNIITEGNEDFVREHLYEDRELHGEVAKLRNNFMNNAQALIHGDLHSGSIFVNDEKVVIIDPEFAFYGPMGYDIGNIVGNLVFSWARAAYTRKNDIEFQEYIKKTIEEIIDKFAHKFTNKYDEIVKLPLYRAENFREYYLKEILADSIGYAATEIIRRTVGDSKVAELDNIDDVSVKINMERKLIEIAIELIKRRYELKDGKSIAELLRK